MRILLDFNSPLQLTLWLRPPYCVTPFYEEEPPLLDQLHTGACSAIKYYKAQQFLLQCPFCGHLDPVFWTSVDCPRVSKQGWIHGHLRYFVACTQQSTESSLIASSRHRTWILSLVRQEGYQYGTCTHL